MQLRGVTREGKRLVTDADGFLKATELTDEQLRAKVTEATVARIDAEVRAKEAAAKRRIAPGAIKGDFPTTGTVRGLIVLAEFEDVKFQEGSTQEYFDKKVNSFGYSGPETYGSVVDYFKEQSGGVFTPEFDVVGPVTLPRKRIDYGYVGYGEDIDGFFREAAIAANE